MTPAWKQIKEKYESRLIDQGTEDLIARRIWKGMGLAGSINKNISLLETFLFHSVSFENPLCDRMIRIFDHYYKKQVNKYNYHYETLLITKHSDVLDRVDLFNDMNTTTDIPVIFTRIKNSNDSNVYIASEYEKLPYDYTPPLMVLPIKSITTNYTAMVIMETAHFISQFNIIPEL